MEDLRDTNAKMRKELYDLFGKTRDLLRNIVEADNIIDKQLQQEESTSDYVAKIQSFQALLSQEECPVVMAGNTIHCMKACSL